MKKKNKRSKRRRVSKEHVANNARQQASTGRNEWLVLPRGVESWCPEKAGTLKLDILPYEVKSDTHPDDIEPGNLWFKMPFATHRDVGPDSKKVVCPNSVDSSARCPICAERKGLMKVDYDGNVDRIKELAPQKWVLFNAFDPEDDSKIVVFAWSRGKFAAELEKELMIADDDVLSFYDVNSDGRTVVARIVKDTYAGSEFFKTSRIDFEKRDELDEDDILGRVACLEECLVVLSEKELNRLHDVDTGSDEADEVDEDEEDEPVRPRKKRRAPEPEEEEEEEEEPEDEEEDEEDFEEDEPEPEPEPKKSKKSKKRRAPEPEEDEDTDDGDDELFGS